MRSVTGWDIGGVNTKVARVSGGHVLGARSLPFEIQRDPRALTGVLRRLAAEMGAEADAAHAVTMTAELSQAFRTKREGVAFVLDAVSAAFPNCRIGVFTTDGGFLEPAAARDRPLAVAAANWAATARVVAWQHRDVVLIDIGTTTTDIIPIAGGAVAAAGRTDPERLVLGELVYTGALRTPAEAMAVLVPNEAAAAAVAVSPMSKEGFALAGDVHVWMGDLDPSDYTVPTPDGRPATREFAGERLARLVCADREMIDERGITQIAASLARSQVADIAVRIGQAAACHPSLRRAVVTGLGAFIAARAARESGLEIIDLATELGDAAARCAPAAAVGLLLERFGDP
jgi:probable H4MPT-linked C1 transfer pathway protein